RRLELREQLGRSRARSDARAEDRVLVAVLACELPQALGAAEQLDDAAELLAARHPAATQPGDHLVGVAQIRRRQLLILPRQPERVGGQLGALAGDLRVWRGLEL